MGELGGLWVKLPLLAFFLIVAALGSAAVPGLNGFVGEFPILSGIFAKSPRIAVLASTGMVLGAFYLLVMLQRVLFGPLRVPSGHDRQAGHDHGGGDHTNGIRPVGWHEIAGLSPLLVLILLIGILPEPFFARIRPAVEPVVVALAREGIPAPEPINGSRPPANATAARKKAGTATKKQGSANTKAEPPRGGIRMNPSTPAPDQTKTAPGNAKPAAPDTAKPAAPDTRKAAPSDAKQASTGSKTADAKQTAPADVKSDPK